MAGFRDTIDVHTHTLASGHAYNTIYEMAREAKERGIELLGITEHAPGMPGTCHEMYFVNLKAMERNLFGVQILFGAEVNVLDAEGRLDLKDSILKNLDIGIASLHLPTSKKGTPQENSMAYVNAMKNPYIHVIGHPDDDRFGFDYDILVPAAKEHHVLLEVNNSSLAPNGYRVNARENYAKMLKLCREYEVPVLLSSDAHTASAIGNHEYAREVLKEAGFPASLVANDSRTLFEEFVPNACRRH